MSLNEKTLLNFSGVFNHQQKYSALQLTANTVFLKHLIVGLGLQLASSIVSNENTFFLISDTEQFF